ncbi:TPA: hypothetical protein ACH3X1_016222 [Trebouxia sp. C0004]
MPMAPKRLQSEHWVHFSGSWRSLQNRRLDRGYGSNIQGINYSNVERWTLPERLMSSTGSDTCVLEKDLILIPVHVSANGTGPPNHWIDVQLDLITRTIYCLDTLKA